MKLVAFSEIAFGQNQRVKSWLRDEYRVVMGYEFQSFLVLNDEKILGAVLFFNKHFNDIELGFFGKGILSRRMIKAIGAYCFIDNCCTRITAKTHEKNITAQKVLAHVGFKPEGRLREFYDDGDAIIYGLLERECKIWQLEK